MLKRWPFFLYRLLLFIRLPFGKCISTLRYTTSPPAPPRNFCSPWRCWRCVIQASGYQTQLHLPNLYKCGFHVAYTGWSLGYLNGYNIYLKWLTHVIFRWKIVLLILMVRNNYSDALWNPFRVRSIGRNIFVILKRDMFVYYSFLS